MSNKSDEEPTQLQSNSSEYNYRYTKSNNPSGLEFVHITKTAGSTIESTAAKSGIKWGACHYKRIRKFGKACSSPDIHLGGSKSVRMEPWHTPHYFFLHNPYEGKPTFCVVRNPYERIISEYYCKFGGYKGTDRDNSTIMNRYVQKRAMQSITAKRAHYLPQHIYVWDKDNNQMVDHILRFENLTNEFNSLMIQYNISIELTTSTKVNEWKSNGIQSRMTVKNLTNETLDILNEVYKEDFQRFHYRMIHVDPIRDDSILLVKPYEWRILLRVQEVFSPLLLLGVICSVLCHIKRMKRAVHSTWFSSLALFFCFLVFLVVIIKLGILLGKTIG